MDDDTVRCNAMWALSNLAASDEAHMHFLLGRGVHTLLVQLLRSQRLDARQAGEAKFVLANMIEIGRVGDVEEVKRVAADFLPNLP